MKAKVIITLLLGIFVVNSTLGGGEEALRVLLKGAETTGKFGAGLRIGVQFVNEQDKKIYIPPAGLTNTKEPTYSGLYNLIENLGRQYPSILKNLKIIDLPQNKIDSLSNEQLLNIFSKDWILYTEKTNKLVYEKIQSRNVPGAILYYPNYMTRIKDTHAPAQLREIAQHKLKSDDEKNYYSPSPSPPIKENTFVWTWVFRIIIAFLILIVAVAIVYHRYLTSSQPININKSDRTFVVDNNGATRMEYK